MLNAAGLDHILPPTRFTVTIHAASVVSVLVTCVLVTTMTATMPSSVAVQVVRGPATVPLMAGRPGRAPGTGGGGSLHHAGDLAGLAAGGALLLAGLAIAVTGLRRRRASTWPDGPPRTRRYRAHWSTRTYYEPGHAGPAGLPDRPGAGLIAGARCWPSGPWPAALTGAAPRSPPPWARPPRSR